jgi:serine/threonine protein kinase
LLLELTTLVCLQIKREISIMKIVRHPNIVRLNEVFHKCAFNFI